MDKKQSFIRKFTSVGLCVVAIANYNSVYAAENIKFNNIVKIDTAREWIDPNLVTIDLNKLYLDYNNLYNDNEFSRLNRIIKQAVNSSSDEVFIKMKNFENVNEKKFKEAMEDINSYYGYSFKSYEIKGNKDQNGLYYLNIKFNYKESKNERDQVNKWIIDQVNNNVLPLKTDIEKIEKINEIILKTLTYDNSLVKTTAYQGIFQGGTVCDGYAVLGHKMLVAAGFKDALTVVGFGTNNGKDFIAHRWNIVRINGKWYHIDFTFNDTGGDPKAYLLKTDEYMRMNHKWEVSRYPISD